MKLSVGAAITAACIVLTGCNDSGGDAAACEEAMRDGFAQALTDPTSGPADKPTECDGLSDAELQTIAERVLAESLGS